jgi:ATP-binding cassette, subfamily A (ABC1), member 3
LIAIAFFYIYNVDVEFCWLFLLLFPLAIVPYTYVTSFMFDDELAAQNFTIYHHFLIAGLGPIVGNVLRIISSTETIGDIMIWIPNLIPSYCLTCGIVSISLKDTIATRRGKSSPDSLDADVGGGHLAFLVIHCFFWAILLVCIELG